MSKIYQKTILDGKIPVKRYLKGFTLIELLVVVLIIGILAAIALPQYQTAVAKSRAVEALMSLQAISAAQHVYYMANGHYSDDLTLLDIQLPGTVSSGKISGINYLFYCTSGGVCQARPMNQNTDISPAFEAQVRANISHCICREKACNICKSMGGIDVGHLNSDDAVYYQI